jgi:hypothetical protein
VNRPTLYLAFARPRSVEHRPFTAPQVAWRLKRHIGEGRAHGRGSCSVCALYVLDLHQAVSATN